MPFRVPITLDIGLTTKLNRANRRAFFSSGGRAASPCQAISLRTNTSLATPEKAGSRVIPPFRNLTILEEVISFGRTLFPGTGEPSFPQGLGYPFNPTVEEC